MKPYGNLEQTMQQLQLNTSLLKNWQRKEKQKSQLEENALKKKRGLGMINMVTLLCPNLKKWAFRQIIQDTNLRWILQVRMRCWRLLFVFLIKGLSIEEKE